MVSLAQHEDLKQEETANFAPSTGNKNPPTSTIKGQ